MNYLIESLQHPYELGIIVILILQMRKPRSKEN